MTRNYIKWTEEQDLLLKELYCSNVPYALISEKLNRAIPALKDRVKKLSLPKRGKLPKFTSEEDLYLRDVYETDTRKSEIVSKLGKPWHVIEFRATTLGLKRRNKPKVNKPKYDEMLIRSLKEKYNLQETTQKRVNPPIVEPIAKLPKSPSKWTTEKDDKLKELSSLLSMSELEVVLDASRATIARAKRRLGLNKRQEWSQKELETIKSLYGTCSLKDMSDKTGRSIKAISHKLTQLGLTKQNNKNTSPEVLVQFILDQLFIDYTKHPIVYTGMLKSDGKPHYYKPDFLIKGNIILEVQGNYYHCNPELYPKGPKYINQAIHVEKDLEKKNWYESNGYSVVYVWEEETKDLQSLSQMINNKIGPL